MTRREWLGVGGVLLSTACGRPKATGYPGYALIATSGSESLAVVDLSLFRLLNPIELGAAPTAVVPGGRWNRSYVLTPSTGSVHLVDANLQRIASQRLADELSGIRLTTDGERLLGISASSREFIEADPTSLKVIKRHKLNGEPIEVDVSLNSLVAVSTGENGIVELFNLATGQRGRTQIAGRIGAVRFRADGQLLLVANFRERSLTALETPSLGVMADLPLAMEPENLCFNSDQGQLFVSGEGMDAVAIVFPYGTLEVEQTVLAGRDPGVMACSDAYLFVGSHSGSDVCILDIDPRKMIGIVEVGHTPTYITVTPDGQYCLVLDKSGGDMAVIHIPAILRSEDAGYGFRRKSGVALFTMLPVGEQPVHAAVVARSA